MFGEALPVVLTVLEYAALNDHSQALRWQVLLTGSFRVVFTGSVL